MPAPPPSAQTEVADLISRGWRRLFNTEPDDGAVLRLCVYFAELERWNRKINLVGRDTPENWIDFHFLDSMLVNDLAATAAGMADIGSGAGFPAMVIKCLRPGLPVTMIEPRGKRAAFLRQAARVIGMTALTVEEKRVEDCAGEFALVTSRALAEIKDFLALAAPRCEKGGIAATLKGEDISAELERFRQAPVAAAFRCRETRSYTLPQNGRRRNLVIFEKL